MFVMQPIAAILKQAGCIPVEGNSKDRNASLFKDTLEILQAGRVVALFPEGTSHSETQLVKLKHGASWVYNHLMVRLATMRFFS